MAVQEGPDSRNEKGVKSDWPVVEGLTAGTTKQTGDKFLHPEEKSLLAQRRMVGIWRG